MPVLSAAEVFQGGDEEGRGPEREGPHQQADPHPGGDHDRAQRPLRQGTAQRRGVLQTSRGLWFKLYQTFVFSTKTLQVYHLLKALFRPREATATTCAWS